MRVKIEPMSSKDYIDMSRGRFITNSGNAANASVCSANIFGDQTNKASKATKQKSADIYHLIGVMQLAMPVPNYFLCGKDLSLLNRILRPNNFDDSESSSIRVKSIMECLYIYDTDNDVFVDINKEINDHQYYDSDRYLIGAEVLQYFISKFDVEQEIRKEILYVLKPLVGAMITSLSLRKFRDAFKDVFINTNGTGIHVVDKYYFTFGGISKKADGVNFNEDESVIKTMQELLNTRIYPAITKSRLSYLLYLRDDSSMSNLSNLIQKYMPVIPIGYRKGVDGEQSPITKAYNKLVSSNESFKSLLKQSNIGITKVLTAYKDLLRWVKYVVADSSMDAKGSDGYKSLIETMTGKFGLIRAHMQGVTIDNSARTVIIVNTKMSIDTVGIPYRILREICDVYYIMYLNILDESHTGKMKMTAKDKLDKLASFKSDSEMSKTKEFIDKLCDVPTCKKDKMYHIIREICPIFMIAIGRQPTLWKYGIQAFKVQPVDGMAIQLAPLCVVAFNADFDGDQMHTSIAVSLDAQMDLANKMANIRNIYLSRDGSCHIFPRHEIIYGLWLASKVKPIGNTIITAPKLTNKIKDSIFEMIDNGSFSLDSVINIRGKKWSLGQMAVKCCAGVKYADYAIGDMLLRKSNILSSNSTSSVKNTDLEDGVCTDSWCKELLTFMYDEASEGERLFIDTINNYTRIGIEVASNYPPDVNLMDMPDVSRYVEEFEERIKKVQYYYNIGLETEEGYSRRYSEEYNSMMKKLKNDLLKNRDSGVYLGDNNGYKLMSESGCRGSDSNIMQMFGIKGRMQRNSTETFNAIIKHSVGHGLTGLEHMICAYGGRQGQIDKSLETATPGAIYRTLLHTMCNCVITEYDCGTDNGILLNWSFLESIVGNGSLRDDLLYDKVKEVFYKLVESRYLVEKSDTEITKSDASADVGIFEDLVAELVDNGRGGHTIRKKAGVHLRSPITCKNPCCQKCYGTDLSKHKKPVIGHAIGMEAAQSISEPLAQLILKNFQKGGVDREGGLTSAFDLIQSYIELRHIDKVGRGKPRFYDVVSPYTGDVEYIDVGGGIRHIFIKSGDVRLNQEPYIMYNSIPIKSYVMRGEGIMLETGNFRLDELEEVLGIDYTIKYLSVKLWQIFNDQDVNIKHFEVLVSCMVFFNCLKSCGEFKAGAAYSLIEYLKNNGEVFKDNFKKVLYSVKSIPEMSNDMLRGLMFNQQVHVASTHILKNNEDSLSDVYVRASLGLDLDIV